MGHLKGLISFAFKERETEENVFNFGKKGSPKNFLAKAKKRLLEIGQKLKEIADDKKDKKATPKARPTKGGQDASHEFLHSLPKIGIATHDINLGVFP